MIANWTRSLMLYLDDEDGECPAEEVIKFQEKSGQFGMSTVPRTPRPKHVKFKVGQVIRHKLWNYRGVIIGWDQKMKVLTATVSWLIYISILTFSDSKVQLTILISHVQAI